MKSTSTKNTIQTNDKVILTASRVSDRTTMRNNSKAYGVCVFESAEKLQSYIDVNGIKARDFSVDNFSCDVWFYPTQDSYTLLSQSEGFSLSVRNNKFNFTFADGESVDAINTESKDPLPEITMRGWNSVFVTYDGKVITFYLQGCPIYSKEVRSHRVVSKDDVTYKIGGDFTGQMRSVRIYNKALPNTEKDNGISRYICKYDYDKSSMAELVAWIDFNQDEIKSLTALSLQFHMHNVCYLDNGIQAISVAGNDYAYTIDTKLNPIAIKKHQHAVYIKFFTSQSNAEKQVLFSNGDFYDNDALIIYIRTKRDLENPQNDISLLCMKIGKQDIRVFSETGYIQDNTWNDLLVTFLESNGQIRAYFYLNGELYGSEDLSEPYAGKIGNGYVKLGNAFETRNDGNEIIANPFDGYISTVAVFDQTLAGLENNSFVNTKKPLEFHENEPFVYELGLVALYNVQGPTPMDWVSGKTIIMHNNVTSEPKIDTICSFIGCITGANNPSLKTPAYNPYLPSYEEVAKKNSLSKRDIKDLDKLGRILLGYFAAVCGVLLSEYAIKLFLYSSGKKFLGTKLMSSIKDGTATPSDVGKFLVDTPKASMMDFSELLAIWEAAGVVSPAIIASVIEPAGIYAIGFIFSILVIEMYLDLILSDTEPDEPDPEQPEEIILTYGNFKMGAISLDGFNAAPTVSYAKNGIVRISTEEPTWRFGVLEGNPSVFIIDKLINGTIELDFYLTPIGEKAPKIAEVTIEVTAQTPYGNLFYKFIGAKANCKVGARNIIVLKSEGYNRPLMDNIYKYTTTYTIKSKINGESGASSVAMLPMYSMPKRPRKPIGYGRKNAIITEFLDMLSTSSHSVTAIDNLPHTDVNKPINDKTLRITGEELALVRNLMNNLFNCPNLQYAPLVPLKYNIPVTGGGVVIDLERIQKEYNKARRAGTPLYMQCAAYSIVLAYMLSVHFRDRLFIEILKIPDNILREKEPQEEVRLKTCRVIVSGRDHGNPKNYYFSNHVITHVGNYYIDGSCRTNIHNPEVYDDIHVYLLNVFEKLLVAITRTSHEGEIVITNERVMEQRMTANSININNTRYVGQGFIFLPDWLQW